jgi:MinD superfamily P-loop ATPase
MEIAVISGKGGTGKSVLSSAFACLSKNIILCDCDVDAANLHILFSPEIDSVEKFISGEKAVIDDLLCSDCGICISHCRFDAISMKNGETRINETNCEGCGLCSRLCPNSAISLIKIDKSRIYTGKYRNGIIVYGILAPGEGNSGKMVSVIRDKARKISELNNSPYTIIDGPPGIACPVIATITGVDQVIIVTEPSVSGLHDLKRILELMQNQLSKVKVIINKYDLCIEMTEKIKSFLIRKNISLIGCLPFDEIVPESIANSRSITEWKPDSPLSLQIKEIWNKVNFLNTI